MDSLTFRLLQRASHILLCESVQRLQQPDGVGMDGVRPWHQSDSTGEEVKKTRRTGGMLWRGRPWMEKEVLRRYKRRVPAARTGAFKREKHPLHLLALSKVRLQ